MKKEKKKKYCRGKKIKSKREKEWKIEQKSEEKERKRQKGQGWFDERNLKNRKKWNYRCRMKE